MVLLLLVFERFDTGGQRLDQLEQVGQVRQGGIHPPHGHKIAGRSSGDLGAGRDVFGHPGLGPDECVIMFALIFI